MAQRQRSAVASGPGERSERFLVPNSFQMPNVFVDRLLRALSGAEVRVLLVLVRKTYGWNKEEDTISLSQFRKISGVARGSAGHAIERFVQSGLLVRTDDTNGVAQRFRMPRMPDWDAVERFFGVSDSDQPAQKSGRPDFRTRVVQKSDQGGLLSEHTKEHSLKPTSLNPRAQPPASQGATASLFGEERLEEGRNREDGAGVVSPPPNPPPPPRTGGAGPWHFGGFAEIAEAHASNDEKQSALVWRHYAALLKGKQWQPREPKGEEGKPWTPWQQFIEIWLDFTDANSAKPGSFKQAWQKWVALEPSSEEASKIRDSIADARENEWSDLLSKDKQKFIGTLAAFLGKEPWNGYSEE